MPRQVMNTRSTLENGDVQEKIETFEDGIMIQRLIVLLEANGRVIATTEWDYTNATVMTTDFRTNPITISTTPSISEHNIVPTIAQTVSAPQTTNSATEYYAEPRLMQQSPAAMDAPRPGRTTKGVNRLADEQELEGSGVPDSVKEVTKIREVAGTIMTDWQIANALMQLKEMSEVATTKAAYERAKTLLVENLPREFMLSLAEMEKKEREEHVNSIAKLDTEHKAVLDERANEARLKDVAPVTTPASEPIVQSPLAKAAEEASVSVSEYYAEQC